MLCHNVCLSRLSRKILKPQNEILEQRASCCDVSSILTHNAQSIVDIIDACHNTDNLTMA
jgi:hypothetical protein